MPSSNIPRFPCCILDNKSVMLSRVLQRFLFLFSFFFFFHPIYYLRPYSLSLLVVTQIRGQSRLFSPPTHHGSCLAFLSQDFSSFFPRRLASSCAYPRQALSAVDPFFSFANKFRISPRRNSNPRINTSSIRGLPLVHRGDRVRI